MSLVNRNALILGERATAQVIETQLKELGFNSILQVDQPDHFPDLPELRSPDRIEKLRKLLMEFSNTSGAGGLIHPGTSRWGELPELPSIAQELNLTAVTPSSKILALFRNKLNLLMEAERIGIPHLALKMNPKHTVREIERFLEKTQQKYPFVLKSAKGGGSAGILVVQNSQMLSTKVPLWIELLRRTQGEVILFAEQYIEGVRHISIPFVRFQDGRFLTFPSVDSSLQCMYRKMIEFSPATSIVSGIQTKITSWTRKLADYLGYVGVGVMEYLVDDNRAYLVDCQGRLNSSFYLWSQVARTDAVFWQMAAIENAPHEKLPKICDSMEWMHGISLKLYSEDSLFHLPMPGIVIERTGEGKWDLKKGKGEVHFNISENQKISALDSGWIGWASAITQDRQDLFVAAQELLSKVWLAGSLQTNERFLMELLTHPWVREEIFHASFVDEEFVPRMSLPPEMISTCLSVLFSHPDLQECESEKFAWKVGDQRIRSVSSAEMKELVWEQGPDLKYQSEKPVISGVIRYKEGQFETSIRVFVFPLRESTSKHPKFYGPWLIRIGNWFINIAPIWEKSIEKKRHTLSAIVSGRLHTLLFRPGVSIAAHETVLVVESMGLFIPHSLPVPSKIMEWKVSEEDQVYSGQELAEIQVYKSD